MTKKSEPIRSCVGCRSRRPTTELHRFQLADGRLILADPGQRSAPGGRGAWICRDRVADCLASAGKVGGFDRAFRTRVDRAMIEQVAAEFVADRP